MSHITHIQLKRYLPPRVKRVITLGGSSWIGEVDESTVLKYPHDPDDIETEIDRFRTEYKILTILGQNPRIIGLKGQTDEGLYLERAINGDLHEFLTDHPSVLLKQRIIWCRQAAEAVAYIHSKQVIHCDIRPRNLLVDKNLDLKLADFQGKHLSEDGEVLLNGLAGEPSRFSCPRQSPNHADAKTDLFALGSTIYFIMTGHDVFPDVCDQDDGSDEEIQRRFQAHQFPQDSHACSVVTAKCWEQAYRVADEAVRDLEGIEKKADAEKGSVARGEAL